MDSFDDKKHLIKLLKKLDRNLEKTIEVLCDCDFSKDCKKEAFDRTYSLIAKVIAKITESESFQSQTTTPFEIETAFWVEKLCCFDKLSLSAFDSFGQFFYKCLGEQLKATITLLRVIQLCVEEILERLQHSLISKD